MQDRIAQSGAGRTLVVSCLAAVGVASAAFAETMVCRMDYAAHDRYIAPEVRLSWDAYGAATVTDSVIAGTGDPSVPGEISPGSAAKVIATWQVRGVSPDPLEQRRGDANLVVRLTVVRADGSARMTINDASNRKFSYRATGACRFGG
ncbi:MAG: hypothetical protein NTW20_17160 [Rhodobacterales bacterium]|nr:hypothetical protein [Rhodobacterales bacterium]